MNISVKILSSDWTLPSRSARKMTDLRPVLQDIGDDHVRTIQERIAQGVDYGGVPLEPLSQCTLRIREWRGIGRTSPLWATGKQMSSWTAKASRLSVRVKPARAVHEGVERSWYGLPSSIHGVPVPIRDVWSLNEDQRLEYGRWIMNYATVQLTGPGKRTGFSRAANVLTQQGRIAEGVRMGLLDPR